METDMHPSRWLPIALAASLGNTPAWAGELTVERLPGNPVSIEVTDQATDGCWTNIAAVRSAAELVFRQSGISVSEDNWHPKVRIGAFGSQVDHIEVCALVVYFEVYAYAKAAVYGFSHIQVFRRIALITGKKTLNQLVLNQTEQFADEFANKYLALVNK